MDLSMWASWLHIVLVVLWVGGLFFQLVALLPSLAAAQQAETKAFLVEPFYRFRPYIWLAIVGIALSGATRVGLLGGMKALPIFVHIKVALGMLMMILGLISTLVLLPRLKKAAEENMPVIFGQALKQYSVLSVVTVLLGGIILWLLSRGGIL